MTDSNSKGEDGQGDEPSIVYKFFHSPKFINPSAVTFGILGGLAFRFDHVTAPFIGIGCFTFSALLLYWAEAQRQENEKKAEELRTKEVSEAKRENEEIAKVKHNEMLEMYVDKEIRAKEKSGNWGLVINTVDTLSECDKHIIYERAFLRFDVVSRGKTYDKSANPYKCS